MHRRAPAEEVRPPVGAAGCGNMRPPRGVRGTTHGFRPAGSRRGHDFRWPGDSLLMKPAYRARWQPRVESKLRDYRTGNSYVQAVLRGYAYKVLTRISGLLRQPMILSTQEIDRSLWMLKRSQVFGRVHDLNTHKRRVMGPVCLEIPEGLVVE